ncbi:MAG: HEAT repeat domain-containing protein [Proteobacteria bacterium]|nr:MAG: HEAT repeat domain-containing protein [Pseudomonadota bacterium]
MAQLASNGQARQASLIPIRDYTNPQALKTLTLLLNSEDASVRDAAAFSLRRVNDPRALPFLIDSLKFGEQTSENVFFALNDLTRGSKNGASIPAAKEQSLLFWRGWATKYKAQLDALSLYIMPNSSRHLK